MTNCANNRTMERRMEALFQGDIARQVRAISEKRFPMGAEAWNLLADLQR
jgi:hypothetical protein